MTIDQNADFRIARDGTWYHDGDSITRESLTKLFATRALKVDEDGKYWLQTPYEKYPVEVEDVPFVIVDYEDLNFRTNLDENITLNETSNWQLRDGIPYIELRDGLMARISRSVLYNLIEEHGEKITLKDKNFALGDIGGEQ